MPRPRMQLSISESPDLAPLGLTQAHVRAALLDIARLLLRRGYDLVYGGDLRRYGYIEELAALVRRQQEFPQDKDARLIWPVIPGGNASAYEAERFVMEWYGEVTLDPIPPLASALTKADLLTHLRQRMAETTAGLVAIGGQTSGFSGSRPGVVEEIGLHAAEGRAVYLIPSFGGATAAAAAALGVALPDYLTPTLRLDPMGTLLAPYQEFAEQAAQTPEPAGLVALLAGVIKG